MVLVVLLTALVCVCGLGLDLKRGEHDVAVRDGEDEVMVISYVSSFVYVCMHVWVGGYVYVGSRDGSMSWLRVVARYRWMLRWMV